MDELHDFSEGPTRAPESCMKCGLPRHNAVHVQPVVEQAIPRLARDALFMQVAELFSMRSSCERGHVGAVLVRAGRIISCGYNGAPPGMQHCLEVGCEEVEGVEGCTRTIHAEANALIWAARMGVPTYDSIMYSTHSPCATCARLIIAAGVSKLYFRNDYRLARLDLLDQAHVLTKKL